MTRGIDVSKWQGEIDWARVAPQVDFAIIRLGYRGYGAGGTVQPDPCFEANLDGAVAAGIPVGVYFFSQAVNAAEGEEEARFCLDRLKDCKLDYPVYFDAEYSTHPRQQGRADNITCAARTEAADAFCRTLEAAGYYAGVYTYTSFALEGKIAYNVLAKRYAMWLADYRENYNKTLPRGMHQYTGSGRVDGIDGDVDWNTCTVDYPGIIREAGLNGWGTPEPPEPSGLVSVARADWETLRSKAERYDRIAAVVTE